MILINIDSLRLLILFDLGGALVGFILGVLFTQFFIKVFRERIFRKSIPENQYLFEGAAIGIGVFAAILIGVVVVWLLDLKVANYWLIVALLMVIGGDTAYLGSVLMASKSSIRDWIIQ